MESSNRVSWKSSTIISFQYSFFNNFYNIFHPLTLGYYVYEKLLINFHFVNVKVYGQSKASYRLLNVFREFGLLAEIIYLRVKLRAQEIFNFHHLKLQLFFIPIFLCSAVCLFIMSVLFLFGLSRLFFYSYFLTYQLVHLSFIWNVSRLLVILHLVVDYVPFRPYLLFTCLTCPWRNSHDVYPSFFSPILPHLFIEFSRPDHASNLFSFTSLIRWLANWGIFISSYSFYSHHFIIDYFFETIIFRITILVLHTFFSSVSSCLLCIRYVLYFFHFFFIIFLRSR